MAGLHLLNQLHDARLEFVCFGLRTKSLGIARQSKKRNGQTMNFCTADPT